MARCLTMAGYLIGVIMTYSEIKQRVFDILQFSTEEATRMGYTERIPRSVNEALFRIANAVMPYTREYKFRLSATSLVGHRATITMPPDFMSFADEQDAYIRTYKQTGDTSEELTDDYFIVTKFTSYNKIILNGREVDGSFPECDFIEYSIFYNAYYPRLIEGGKYYDFIDLDGTPAIDKDNWSHVKVPVIEGRTIDDVSFELPTNIGDLIPHYVVGQLLTLDDKVRSITEMNEFETMLAQLNVSRNERQREYRSSKGWY